MKQIKKYESFISGRTIKENVDQVPGDNLFILSIDGDLSYKYYWDGAGWWARNVKTGKILDLKNNSEATKILDQKFSNRIQNIHKNNSGFSLEKGLENLHKIFQNLRQKYLQSITDLYIIHPAKEEIGVTKEFLDKLDDYSDRIFETPHKIKILLSLSYWDTLETLDIFIKSGAKNVQNLVIGSHGDGKNLLIDAKNKVANKVFFYKVEKLLSDRGIVYFTACYGAQNLRILAQASQITGKKTYANTGVNFLGFGGNGVFYKCVPSQEKLDDMDNETIIKRGICSRCSSPPIWWVTDTNSNINLWMIKIYDFCKTSQEIYDTASQKVQDMGNYIKSAANTVKNEIKTMKSWVMNIF